MKKLLGSVVLGLAFAQSVQAGVQHVSVPFTGTWSLDLRTPAEKAAKAECGTATFQLQQVGEKIVGEHSFATVHCARINEGGAGSVKGVAVGKRAVLVVTSARNGQIVVGAATVRARALHWKVVEEIKPGEPPEDSGLILQQGVLQKVLP